MHIVIDGFNTAMPRGTGVATYGRMLAQTLADGGYWVDGIFGLLIDPAAPEQLRGVEFSAGLGREEGVRAKTGSVAARWIGELAYRVRPIIAATIPTTGHIDARVFQHRLPDFQRILNATNLFHVAHRHFRATGRFLCVRVPAPVPEIIHWTYPMPLTMLGARNVYTLHDLVPLRLPYTTMDNKPFYLRLLQACVRHADHLCTVSEASRHDIMTMLGVSAERVTNTYQNSELPALSPELATTAGLASWLDGLFSLQPGNYLLYYGALEPKKNIGRIIEAFLGSSVAMPLVIVGGRAWKSENELRLLQPDPDRNRIASGRDRVRQLEFVPAAWLSGLVRGARAVVFPSLSKEFGLPVLEAM